MRKNKNTSGFTLIELLIVIAIIGVLSAITISLNYESIRAKTRDTERIVWLNAFAKALELYYDTNGRYPGQTSPDFPAGNSPQDFNYGLPQSDGTCTGFAEPLQYDNSYSEGFLDILYPEYISISGFFDPIGQDTPGTPFNCRYIVTRAERNANNVQSYLMHCKIERLFEQAESDQGYHDGYYERIGGDVQFCLKGHNDD